MKSEGFNVELATANATAAPMKAKVPTAISRRKSMATFLTDEDKDITSAALRGPADQLNGTAKIVLPLSDFTNNISPGSRYSPTCLSSSNDPLCVIESQRVGGEDGAVRVMTDIDIATRPFDMEVVPRHSRPPNAQNSKRKSPSQGGWALCRKQSGKPVDSVVRPEGDTFDWLPRRPISPVIKKKPRLGTGAFLVAPDNRGRAARCSDT